MNTHVLGASGRLGGVLWRHAKQTGAVWFGQSRHDGFEVQSDGRFPAKAPLFLEHGSTLINMIGDTGNDENRLGALNVDFVRDLLLKAGDAGVSHVLLASSAAVYGTGHGEPFDEDSPLAPLTHYARSKALMENVANDLTASGKSPPVTILRIANVAGSDALSTVARAAAAAGKPMTMHKFASGKAALRSYIGPADLFRCICALAAAPPQTLQTFNICAPAPVRLDALITSYKATLFPDLSLVDGPAPDGTPEEVVLSTAKLERVVRFDDTASQPDAMARQVAKDLNT